jgi:outer membrane protein assembly factor BamA
MRFSLMLAGAMIPSLILAQDPPQCSALRSEVTLGPLSGHRIDSVLVETAQPNIGRLARIVGKMHVRTRPDVVRRELLFAPGDTVDTLIVAESLRRLRKLPFLEYAHIETRQCPSQSGESLALSVVTRDAWTTRPDIKASSTSPRIGVSERDLFGTGRTVAAGLVSRNGALGAAVSASDAFGFGTGMTTRAQYQQYSDGSNRSLSISRRQATLTDKWRVEVDLYDQQYEPKAAIADNFERTGGDFIGAFG